MPPLPNIEHQIMATDLALAFAAVIDRAAGDLALVGANVSDRVAGWEKNYREPDVLVVLNTNVMLYFSSEGRAQYARLLTELSVS